MKIIVHIIPFFQPMYGYEETYHSMAHASLGYDVHVLTSKYVNPNLTNNKLDKIDTSYDKHFRMLTIHRLPSRFIPFQSRQLFLIGLFSKLSDLRPDIIVMHGAEFFTYIPVAFFHNNSLLKITDVHKSGSPRSNSSSIFFRFIKNTLRSLAIAINFRYSDYLLFYSQSHMREFNDKYIYSRSRFVFHPMPYNSDIFMLKSDSGIQFSKNNSYVPIFMISGRLVPEKKICEILSILFSSYKKPFKVLLIGRIHTSYKSVILGAIPPLFHSQIIFIPSQHGANLAAIYNSCDFGLWLEHYSVGILEAMACGVTVYTNHEAGLYYPFIPPERILTGCLEDKIASLIAAIPSDFNSSNSAAVKQYNSSLVSGYTYSSLARFTSSLPNRKY